jgi:hypothetical protein
MAKALTSPRSTLFARALRVVRKNTTQERPKRRCNADDRLREEIVMLKKKKPTWGIRRVHAWLRKKGGFAIGRKKVRRIMKEENLLCPLNKKRTTRRTTLRKEAEGSNQLWGQI